MTFPNEEQSVSSNGHSDAGITDAGPSRRQVLAGASGVGLLAAAPVIQGRPKKTSARLAAAAGPDGTPEQIHLTWGGDPARSMVASWASPGQASRPRVLLSGPRGSVVQLPAVERTYTDGINGETVWTYHVEMRRLDPNESYTYTVTADNDGAAEPFTGTFRTAPAGREPFRFTSFGDLATPNTSWVPGTSFYVRGYSGGEQTRWLERTLREARSDPSIDWIVAQMHQIACSSAANGNGSDLGIRQEWLPLFDRYQVDLVLTGHDHDYERSFPCRGFDSMAGTEAATGAPVQTLRPHPVTTTDSGVFDTSLGTVHLVLGSGGTSANLDKYGVDSSDGLTQAKVFTVPNRPALTGTPGVYARAAADAREDAVWSAQRDTQSGYGIAVFDVDPGNDRDGQTSITVRYFHALGADPVNPTTGAKGAPSSTYTEFESFTLVRPRADRQHRNQGQRAGAVAGR